MCRLSGHQLFYPLFPQIQGDARLLLTGKPVLCRKQKYDVTASNDLSSYTDVSQISEYATAAMQWANAEELITGRTSTTLASQGNATRAEVATILMRFCENIAG